jgi:hypothetical protein
MPRSKYPTFSIESEEFSIVCKVPSYILMGKGAGGVYFAVLY